MEAITRWLCSFKADNVSVTPHTQTVTCGDNVLLCSIDLPNSTSKFTDYHENKITVLYRNRIVEAGDCCFDIRKVNSRKLNVYCYARRSGKATVRLDLGKWYQFEGPTYYYQDLDIDILPSTPKYLRDVKVCCQKNSVDEQHTHEVGTVYYGIESFLKFEAVDEFENIIHQLEHEKYDVKINYSECNVLQNVEWEIREGIVFATFFPDIIGDMLMVVQLVDKGLNRASSCSRLIPVKVLHPPCSPSLTLKVLANIDLEQSCMAGEEFTFEVKLLDIFGNPVHQDSNETYGIVANAPLPKRKVKKRQEEHVNTKKIDAPKSFAVTVGFKIAGNRKVTLTMNSRLKSSSQDIYVQVVPSAPHHLNDVRCTTIGVIDDDFIQDPTVMYRNQWSVLEGGIVDCYDNDVAELSNNCNISLELTNDKGKDIEIASEDLDVENKTFRAQVQINQAGKHNLVITLTGTTIPNDVVRLKETEIEVDDPPLYLAGSNICYPNISVAGKEIQLKIFPVDVFGLPIPADSTTDMTLNSSLEFNENKETINFTITRSGTNIVINSSVVLNNAGSREVFIFDKNNTLKQLTIYVEPDVNDVHWEFTFPKQTAYRRENLVLTLRLFDRFGNEVKVDPSRNIPKPLKENGPDGLRCTMTCIENNKVVIHCHFTQTGKYDVCLVNSNGTLLEGSQFLVTVEDAPLDYHRSTIEWIPQYNDFPDQPVFPNDKTFECCLKLKDIVGCDYDGRIEVNHIKVKHGNAEVEDLEISSCHNEVGSYNIVVPLMNLLANDPSPKFWCFVNDRKIVNPLVLQTFETFRKYDDGKCKIAARRTMHGLVKIIVCQSVEKKDINGSDFSHLNNIKRVCELDEAPKIETCQLEFTDECCTVVELALDETDYKIQKCRKILLRLLRAIYYRKEGFKLDKAREKWKNRAIDNYNKMKGDCSHFCSQIKEKHAKLMRKYHDAACEEFFQFFNAERCQSEIDLHGLLVMDEAKLREYKQQLRLKDLSATEVNRIIERERKCGNEAIRKLQERLSQYNLTQAREEKEPWLEIIVGSGRHSKDQQRIRPKVEEYLRGRQLNFSPVNKGALVVTFQKYAGPEPCFGEYYCTKCDNKWRNSQSWIDKWQACYVCHKDRGLLVKCDPLKQRSSKKQRRHNPKFVPRNKRYVPNHVQELCQKCQELGRDCQRAWSTNVYARGRTNFPIARQNITRRY